MEPLTRSQIDELDQIMHPNSAPRPWSMAELEKGPLTVQDIPRPAKPGEGEPGQQTLLSGRHVDVKPGLDDIVKQVSEVREIAEGLGQVVLEELATQILRLASIVRYQAGQHG